MEGYISKIKNGTDYTYPVTVSEAVFYKKDKSLKQVLDDVYKFIGSRTSSYIIDLVQWDLNNNPLDLTDEPTARLTSIRLNAAIQWAKDQGYNEVILPQGTYLIDEYNPILLPSYLTLNLGGSTLRIRTNGQIGYEIIMVKDDAKFSRITNGTIQGDRWDHDYTTISSTHEFGEGIQVKDNCQYISVDNLEILDCTGDGINTALAPNYQTTGADLTTWEQGDISHTDGTLSASTSVIRLVDMIDITKGADILKYGYFNIGGNGWGDFGGDIKNEVFDIFFYDSTQTFISYMDSVVTFDDVAYPKNTNFVRLVLHQATIPTPANVALSIQMVKTPRNIYVEKCNIHHARRCGLAATGRYIYIRDNNIHDISGTGPGAVIDFEDGYGSNQYFFIENNYLYNCKVGLSLVSTRNVIISNNVLDRLGLGTVWDECRDIVYANNTIRHSSIDIHGDCVFTGNSVYNSNVESRYKGRHVITNNYFYNSSFYLSKDTPRSSVVDGCSFYIWDLTNGDYFTSSLSFVNTGQVVSNCIFEGNLPIGVQDELDWEFINCIWKDRGSIPLPAGTYKNCRFENTDYIQFKNRLDESVKYEFYGCEFIKPVTNMFFFPTPYNPGLLKFKGCKFVMSSNKQVAYFAACHIDTLHVEDCDFDCTAITTAGLSVFDWYSTQAVMNKLIMKNNRFKATVSMSAANLSTSVKINLIVFDNNTMEGVIQDSSHPNIISRRGNIWDGVYEADRKGTSAPSTGTWNTGDIFLNSSPTPGGYLGWVCTTGSTFVTATRQASHFYNPGDQINMGNGYIAECITGGYTRVTPPTWSTVMGNVIDDSMGFVTWTPNTTYTTGTYVMPTTPDGNYYWVTQAGTTGAIEPDWTQATITDGTVGHYNKEGLVQWKVVAPQPVFKPYGLISE